MLKRIKNVLKKNVIVCSDDQKNTWKLQFDLTVHKRNKKLPFHISVQWELILSSKFHMVIPHHYRIKENGQSPLSLRLHQLRKG